VQENAAKMADVEPRADVGVEGNVDAQQQLQRYLENHIGNPERQRQPAGPDGAGPSPIAIEGYGEEAIAHTGARQGATSPARALSVMVTTQVLFQILEQRRIPGWGCTIDATRERGLGYLRYY